MYGFVVEMLTGAPSDRLAIRPPVRKNWAWVPSHGFIWLKALKSTDSLYVYESKPWYPRYLEKRTGLLNWDKYGWNFAVFSKAIETYWTLQAILMDLEFFSPQGVRIRKQKNGPPMSMESSSTFQPNCQWLITFSAVRIAGDANGSRKFRSVPDTAIIANCPNTAMSLWVFLVLALAKWLEMFNF